MGLLANFKIRTKVLLALLPLAVMVIVAVSYSSMQMKKIDTEYSSLVGQDVKALQNLTVARALNNKFALLVYKEIAEFDVDRMRVIDADIDSTAAEFHSAMEETMRESPSLAPAVKAVVALFDETVSDSRPVRAATLINSNDKAMKLMREGLDPELL